MGRYQQEFRRSLADSDQFWRDAAGLIDWYTEPSLVLDRSTPPLYRWFTGGTLNTCLNAVDRHVRDGRAGQPALIYRHARGRSSARPCAASRTVMTSRCLRPLRIQPRWMRSGRSSTVADGSRRW